MRYMYSGSSRKTAFHLQSQAVQLFVSYWTMKITELLRRRSQRNGEGELCLKYRVVTAWSGGNVYRVIGGNGLVECIQGDWWEWVSGMYTG